MNAHRSILSPHVRPASLRAAASAGADYGADDQPDWRAVPWQTHLHAMTIDARRVHVCDVGSGERAPLLLIHGLGGRWQNWLPNIPRLAERRRVVAVDLPGFGHSQLPVEPISIAGYARTLEGVCDLLELDAAIAVGNSLGGLVATELALRQPDRVAGLVLVSAACLAPDEINVVGSQLALLTLARIAAVLPRGAVSTLRRPRARHVAFATVLRHPTRLSTDLLYELAGGPRPPGTLDALAALTAHPIRDELSQITQPTLIVHGRDDLLIPCSDSEQLATLIRSAELHIFEDTGHMPMVERPVRFNDLLLRFVDERARAGGEDAPTPTDEH
jgi:pimeloyl-ACP methyl ester carboxylesterase